MIIVDAGAWIGLVNRRDTFHAACRAFFSGNREPLITTFPVLVEVTHLLQRRVGVAMTIAWLETIRDNGVQVFSLQQHHLHRITGLMRRYRDLPMDLADASLVVLAEEIGTGRILSTDQRDFGAYRWQDQQPFENLLVPGIH